MERCSPSFPAAPRLTCAHTHTQTTSVTQTPPRQGCQIGPDFPAQPWQQHAADGVATAILGGKSGPIWQPSSHNKSPPAPCLKVHPCTSSLIHTSRWYCVILTYNFIPFFVCFTNAYTTTANNKARSYITWSHNLNRNVYLCPLRVIPLQSGRGSKASRCSGVQLSRTAGVYFAQFHDVEDSICDSEGIRVTVVWMSLLTVTVDQLQP